ncbi:MAG: PilX N-terminal domain-containing pilus assembly protein [Burkholderiaceae bacterium]|jgi:type IV pilus assembly protein PilX
MHVTPAIATSPLTTRSGSRGIALPIVLMFLLIITIAAAFGIRRATLGEGITRNQLDYEVARQAAEAALRDAERDLFPMFAGKPAGAVCDRSPDRPLPTKFIPSLWTTDCRKGQCLSPPAYLAASNYATGVNPQPWWPASKDGLWGDNEAIPVGCDFDGGIPIGTFTGTPNINGVARQPEYMLEWIDRATDTLIRVTARGFGADINTEVVLQTYVKPPGK